MASEQSLSEGEPVVRLRSYTRSTGHENDGPALPSDETGEATAPSENREYQMVDLDEADRSTESEMKASGDDSIKMPSGPGSKSQVPGTQKSGNCELPEYKDQVRNLEESDNCELPEYKDQVRNVEERSLPAAEGVALSVHENSIRDGSTIVVVADARVLEVESLTFPPSPPLPPFPPGGINPKNTLGRLGTPTDVDCDDPGGSASQSEPSATPSALDNKGGKKRKWASLTYAAVTLGVLLAIVVPVAVILPSNGSEQGTVTPAVEPTLQPHLFAVAQAEDDLSKFVELVEMVDTYDFSSSGLIELLTDRSLPWTVMAPTNKAFEQVDQDLLAKYSTPRWSAHWACMAPTMIPSLLYSDNITDGLTIDSRGGSVCLGGVYNFSRQRNDSEIYFNLEHVLLVGDGVYNGQVLQADLRASNGIIHKTDVVPAWPLLDLKISLYEGLAYPSIAFTQFSTLKSLIEEAGLVELFNTTAMTGFAFAVDSLPPGTLDAVNKTELLLNHIVLGDPLIPYFLTRQRSIVTAAGNTYVVENSDSGFVRIGGVDVLPNQYSLASNGMVYYLSGLLLVPSEK